MNTEEQTLIDGLFTKLKQAETDSAPRDAQAEALIKEHLTRQPAAPYYMAQAILVQEVALKQMEAQNRQRDEQIQQLQAELARVKAQPAAPAQSGGFLSSIFGGGSRDPQPQQPASSFSRPASPPPSSAGGWRDGPASPPPYSPPPQGNYGQPQPQQQAPAAPFGSGFLGGALKTAAGVAGGVMLAEGISSLFHHNSQPQEIVEIIEQQPAQPASDSDFGNGGGSNWGDDQQRVTSNDNWGNDSGGFADTDYSNDDSGGFFGGDDDDSYV